MSRLVSKPEGRGEEWSLDDVQYLHLEGVSWELYEHLLKVVGDRPLRLTYDNGELEIMSPLAENETAKKIIGRLIETLTEEWDIPLGALGSTTFRRKRRRKGLEPDECFYIVNLRAIAGKKRLSLPKDPPPDLAVEVDVTSRSIPRLPIYAALEVPEVWRFDGQTLHCLHLGRDGEYHRKSNSRVFPDLKPLELLPFIEIAIRTSDQNAAVKAFRKWIRASR